MIYSRSKSQIRKDEATLEKASNQLAIDCFTEQGIKALLTDTGRFRRANSGRIPDLLLKYEQTRMLCEVKTLATIRQHKDCEALTHEIERLMVKLPVGFYYDIWYEKEDANLKSIDLKSLFQELEKSVSHAETLPFEFVFQETVKIILHGRSGGSSELTCFHLGSGVDKTYDNIRAIISRAGRQLSGRLDFHVPKICLIINRRTKGIEFSFRNACLGDPKFSVARGSLVTSFVNTGNAAHTPGSNRSISATLLISPDMRMEPLLFSNPYAEIPLPPPLLSKWQSWLIN